MIFPFILIMVCCVCSLESPRCGDSNENTQHTFMLSISKNYHYQAIEVLLHLDLVFHISRKYKENIGQFLCVRTCVHVHI